MRRCFFSFFLTALICAVLCPVPAGAGAATGTISGIVTDRDHDVLPSAPVKLDPGNISVLTNEQGEFSFRDVAPGAYTVTITYVGFAPLTTSVTVVAGQVATVDAVMQVSAQNQEVVVTAGRSYGEAESINEIRSSENILNILPAAVITSLPNSNIADAVGRLPSVTLERDEGEGKYVRIRGTEARLSNLTIDGVEIPSPEGSVRQVKLDVVPAGLIESVQIFKTLQANQSGDAIGGTVNLVTKTAGGRPTLSLFGSGGFTPIIHTVPVGEFGGTLGKRFGVAKRFGALISGSYDYNGRGIDDFEPIPDVLAPNNLTPKFDGTQLRSYKYNRKRYGFGGTTDYKLGESSLLFIRGLFSDFKDDGHRWDYDLNQNDAIPGTNLPVFRTELRDGHYRVASVLVGGNHVLKSYWVNWQVAAPYSRMLNPIQGGESITIFSFVPPTSNCQYDAAATKNPYYPKFTQACFTEAYNPANFQLSSISDAAHGKSAQQNLEASISAGKTYRLGSHPSSFELGFLIRNGHKWDNSFENDYTPIDPTLPAFSLSNFINGYTNPNYYGGNYKFGPSGDWERVQAFRAANPGLFTVSGTQGGNANNFSLIERVTAGYFMNTIDFSRFTLVAGVRFEGTQVNSTSFSNLTGTFVTGSPSPYTDVLPSASLRYKLDTSSALRFVYGRGLSRPIPQDLTTAITFDQSTNPATCHIGNVVKAEHAHNFDVLYERYLTPLGLIQGGFFYKNITDPIVTIVTAPAIAPPGCPANGPNPPFNFVAKPANGGSAYISGLELSFQQHFTYLPGWLGGFGILANYSYATSGTSGVNPLRTDNPALLNQARNTWNISPTYDRGPLSIRVGLAYNGPNIDAYMFQNLMVDPNTGKIVPVDPTTIPGGVKGPHGDNYLFSHFQVDLQGSYRLRRGLTAIASGLNLNNAVFGFYNGSPIYFNQREFYKPTYSFGLRWDLHGE
jgi:TonB-dependent receptor